MDTIFAYLLRCIVSSGILTAYYWFVLRNKKFHAYNRFYLLFTLLISLILPFLHFQWISVHQVEHPYVNGFINTINPTVVPQAPTSRFPWERLLVIAGLFVSAALLIILIIRILRLFREIRTHTHIRIKGVFFIETKMEQAPFSFLNYLFWKKNISLESDNGEKIFKHELTHIEQLHTYDKLFSQLAVCILWINPFYWIIQRELNMIHEFIADERSVNDGDTESFARMLLLSHNGGAYLDPTHSFFHSPIKRRLAMI
ncbi:MAG TPA: M56 family metallopeptidase, partial [Puia sp.]|nr:M56 family metallopeptidase [Puia sp.]